MQVAMETVSEARRKRPGPARVDGTRSRGISPTISAVVDEDVRERLQALADERGIKISKLVREILEQHVSAISDDE